MKKAIMYGAGNIGRGFIGKLLSESGYEVCFVDIVDDVVVKLNQDMCYPVSIVSDANTEEVIVHNVRAVNGRNRSQVADEIATADILATAVGVHVLPEIIDILCEGLRRRSNHCNQPLNIIICENLMDADTYLRKMITEQIGSAYKDWVEENIGFVEASIGRMIPVMTDPIRENNILRVCVEPYEQLFLDIDGFVGALPEIKNTLLYSPFSFYIKRKLFIHNMGHSMSAYLGYQKNYQYIHECIKDSEIQNKVKSAMMCVADALFKSYNQPAKDLQDHVMDLLYRFSNSKLADTVERVAKDPIRKLHKKDRLIGAALFCEAQNVDNDCLLDGIAAALHYLNNNDKFSIAQNKQIQENGIMAYLETVIGLDEKSNLRKEIIKRYNTFEH